MNKSKNLLLFKVFFLGMVFLYIFIVIFIKPLPSSYHGYETQFYGIIQKIQKDEHRITITLKAKEKLLVSYKTLDCDVESYQLGDTLYIEGTLENPSENRNFYLFSYKKYLLSQKIFWIVQASSIQKVQETHHPFYQLKNFLQKRVSFFQNKAYFQAFLLGNTKDIQASVMESYRVNGISHLFAISGMHISLLASVLVFFVKKMRFSFLFLFSFFLLYLFITDFSPSVIRASFLFLGGYWCKQKKWSLSSIELCIFVGCVSLLYNPYLIYSTSFQYSYLVTFFLLYFQDKLKDKSYFRKIFLISMLAFFASAPISVQQNFELNFLSIFNNLFFVPFVSLWIFPLIWICFFVPILEFLLTISLSLLEWVSFILSSFSFFIVPFGHLSIQKVVFYYLLLMGVLRFHQKTKIFCIVGLFFFFLIHYFMLYFNPYYTITMFDVGQGDAILITFPHSTSAVLIDTGNTLTFQVEHALSDMTLLPCFKALGVHAIDTMILSHGDCDHMLEAKYLLSKIKVGKVYLNSGANTALEEDFMLEADRRGVSYEQVSQKDVVIQKTIFSFLNPQNIQNENEDSIVIYTKLNGRNILFMSDAGETAEKNILYAYPLPKMDIVKVGHHGSKYSSTIPFLEVIRPSMALISAGKNNLYQHPHQETLRRFDAIGTKYYITSIHGSIRIILKDKIELDTCL